MSDDVDLLVIGGGINGVGIARDAAGRGLRVLLVERDDLASHTSSASTKLIHGGLRYLEHYKFRLVRESLAERELLLTLAPHLIRPMRFVMPLARDMRPAWLIRAGLLLYDRLGGRSALARSAAIRLTGTPWGAGLRPIERGFVYSDGWVDDARLVVANALGAAELGADIRTRTAFVGATRDAERWSVALGDGRRVTARAIVNAAGPWVGAILGDFAGSIGQRPPRLVKGSHIIVPRLAPGDHGFILQNHDRRVIFAIPYEQDFTLVGTTDRPFTGDPSAPVIDPDEVDYLCASVNRYFVRQVGPGDVVSSYSGVRPLYDDGRDNASEVTRDYVLATGYADGPQLLSVFGGKITTYRRLAEQALDQLAPFLPPMGPRWTATAPLPGGDLGGRDVAAVIADARQRWPALPSATVERMVGAYGSRLGRVLAGIDDAGPCAAIGKDLVGTDLGEGLMSAEVDYLVREEWARTVDDILLRRTKLGLHGGPALRAALAAYLDPHQPAA